jgi:hypothetical protein
LARNIEAQAENWDSGIVNTGCLFRGNAGEEDNCTYNGGKVEFGIERSAKAGHLTSEGDTIWDLSGNLYEFVDWGANTDFTKTPAIDMSICNSADEWQEFTDLLPLLATCSGIIANDYSPNDQSLNSTHKLGQIFLSNEGHAIRGGSWRTVALTAGIFNLNLSSDGSRNSLIGFRCVYRP